MTHIPIRGDLQPPVTDTPGKKQSPVENKESFGAVLTNKIKEINQLQHSADSAIANVEVSDSGSIHEAMIAIEKANLSFKTMMQVRNKILDAYQEVMRMQV